MTRALFALATLMSLTPALWAQQDLKLPAETDLYPLKPGTTWEYKSGNKTIIVKVEKLEKLGDDVCARLVSEVKDDKEKKTRSEHITVRKDDGVYRIAYQDSRLDPPLCFLKLPATGKWPIEAKMFNVTLKGEGSVEKTEKVKVGDKEYDATVVQTNLTADKTSMKITYYFAKDVGIVKQVVNFNNNEVTQELVSFTPGK